MTQRPTILQSDMGWSLPDHITIKGYDLVNDLMGHLNLGDMAFLMLQDRLPTPQESTVFNALLVTLVEHGITPNAIAARLTYLGAPEAIQGAVAAGLLGVGSRFVGTIGDSAEMLQQALQDAPDDADLGAIAEGTVTAYQQRNAIIPGLGHPFHKPVDPRTPRLFQIAAENGVAGRYVQLMERIAQEAERRYQRSLPINATGAIGAIASEFGIPSEVCRGLGVMARAVGLVGHILEELRQPMAREVWLRVEEEATRHLRPPS